MREIPLRGITERLDSCACHAVFTPTVGTYDTLTNEWLSERLTMHVRIVDDPACPVHNSTPDAARADSALSGQKERGSDE